MSNLVGLLVPAGLLSLAIFMHILACAMYNNWWPLMSLLLYALMLLPLAALARQSESLFDSAPTGFHWAIFLLASLVTLVIGVPIVMWHVDVIESGSVSAAPLISRLTATSPPPNGPDMPTTATGLLQPLGLCAAARHRRFCRIVRREAKRRLGLSRALESLRPRHPRAPEWVVRATAGRMLYGLYLAAPQQAPRYRLDRAVSRGALSGRAQAQGVWAGAFFGNESSECESCSKTRQCGSSGARYTTCAPRRVSD